MNATAEDGPATLVKSIVAVFHELFWFPALDHTMVPPTFTTKLPIDDPYIW
jgi:hypothetical protein